jgi:predicted ATP-grasp superfamily ATP-dependent carboligase
MDKVTTLRIANKIGIPLPKTSFARNADEIEIPAEFPLIVKPSRGSGSRGMSVVGNVEELKRAVAEISKRGLVAIIQEKIPVEGAGYGVSVLFNFESKPRAVFVHKRLREYPVKGGPSTLRISVKYPELAETGVSLMKEIGWIGAGMVEFKIDPRDGVPKLMEINPRLWGSLQLSISSGIDFPELLVKMALDGDIPEIPDYKEGIMARWLLPGDILHFISNPNRFKLDPRFFKFFDKNLVYDDFARDDMAPVFATLLEMFVFLFDPEMRKIVFR